MDQRPKFTQVLQNRGFVFLWLNQILIQLAYNTLNFALLIWVFKLTDSNIAVAALMLCVFLPAILFGLVSGIYVDIADRRKIILVIDLLLALSFFVFIFIKESYPLILLNTFFINTLGQFFVPTESSSIPMLVSKKQLILANSLFSLTLYGSFMVGFATAGPILSYQGINTVFILGIIASLLAWFLSRNLPVIQVSKGAKFKSMPNWSEIHKMIDLTLAEGKLAAKFIKGKLSVMAAIILMAGIQGVIGVLAVLVSSYMETVLHIHATDASYVIMIPLGLGMVVGALLIGRFASHLSKRYLVIPSLITVGVLFFIAGITPYVAHIIQVADLPDYIRHPRFFFRAPSLSLMFAIGSFLTGMAAVGIIVPSQTVMQENTTEQNRGKIFAVLVVVMNIVAAVTSVFAGIFADLLGTAPIFILMALIILPVGLFLRNPSRFLKEHHLPYKLREFLGLGFWNK